jgi:hypothetical protein
MVATQLLKETTSSMYMLSSAPIFISTTITVGSRVYDRLFGDTMMKHASAQPCRKELALPYIWIGRQSTPSASVPILLAG